MQLLKRSFLGIISLVLAFASVQQLAFTNDAQAAYQVTAGSTFNNPYGTSAQRLSIINKINQAIDNTPKGSVIRIVTYSLKYDVSVTKLIAAHKRGAIVQVITSDHLFNQDDEVKEAADTAQLRRLIGVIKNEVEYDNSKSFVKVCSKGCTSSNAASSVHTKAYMFSKSGSSKLVTMISSSNLSEGHAFAWNNMYTSVNNKTLYDSLLTTFYKMARDKNANMYQNIAVSDSMRLYTFPRKSSALDDDVHYTMLEKIRCTGAASGYGVGGKTAIDFAMFKWTDSRSEVAEKLRALANSGCRVRVITDKLNMSTGILRTLTEPKSGKASTVIVKDADTTINKQFRYMHHKYITINGYYVDPAYSDEGNRKSKIVFTGSPNLTYTGLQENDEVMLRLRNASEHTLFTKNFELIWSKYSKAFKWVDPN